MAKTAYMKLRDGVSVGQWRVNPLSSGGIFLAILAAAAWLRVDGIDWALPHVPHPDEARIIDYVIVSAPGIPREVFSDYGALPFHLLGLVGSLASLAVRSYAVHDPGDALNTYIIARFMAATFGVGTVALTYLAGTWAYGKKAGLLAAASLAVAVLPIQLSRTYTVDVILVFWTTLFLVIGLRMIRRPSDSLYMALMIVTGAAIATKIVAVFLFFPMGVALFLAAGGIPWREAARGRTLLSFLGRRSAELGGGFVIAALTFMVLTPTAVSNATEYWWLNFDNPDWWRPWIFPEGSHRLMWNLLLSEGTVRPLWSVASAPALRLANPVSGLLPWGIGPLLLIMSGVGTVFALKRRTRADWLLLSFLLASYLTVATSQVQFIRYVYPMVPALSVLAARPLVSYPFRHARRKLARAVLKAALVTTLVFTALYGLAFTSIYRSPDTRLQAEKWIRKSVPPGSSVGIDGPELFSDPYVDAATYRIHLLPIYRLFEDSTPHTYGSSGPITYLLGDRLALRDNDGHLSEEQMESLVQDHLQSDYLVISNRLGEQVETVSGGFEKVKAYYQALADGSAGYKLVKEFRSDPRLWGLSLDDSGAEHTFKIFDHPTILIYERTGS